VDAIDLTAQPDMSVEVEVQHEAGLEGRYKLYVHVDGITVLRISKMTKAQLRVILPPVPTPSPDDQCRDPRCLHTRARHNEDGICSDAECPCYHFTAGFLERTR